MKKTMRRRASPRPAPKKASKEHFKKLAARRGLKPTWASPNPGRNRGKVALDGLNRVMHPHGKQTPWMRGLDHVQKRVDTER